MAKKTCCTLWTIFAIIVALVAIAGIVYCVLKKLDMLGTNFRILDEGFWKEEISDKGSVDANGVPYTTDRDFV